jgi:lysozyme family protein
MSASTYDEALRRLLGHEGGYVNHPSDPGGPTNFGITLADYRKYRKPDATAADVRVMRIEDAKAIYRAKYWNAQRCDELPAGVDYSIFDYGVNSGLGRSGKVLRRVLGLPANTSVITTEVLQAAAKRDPKALVAAINDERLSFLKRLRTWPTFGTGWSRRVAEVRSVSLRMVAGQRTTAPIDTKTAHGKGSVPNPDAAKKVIVGVGTGAPAVTAGGCWSWIVAHPWETGVIAVGIALVVGAAVYALSRWHRSAQEAPAPLTPVVPAIQA